ncbi:N-acetylmuramoyl-L-alanine amidase [Stackebrandtia albiflava]|uniref:N-acetylmuramoyl-L-alanine amidase n=1 Tax=Stackebrandtia albiflava TaxID=406432 RepID=A0A562V9V5_9ACTN|nr:N-acetylmuramoyl-L-alanine amidase [Stackebrandtia albiflava]TWJ14631.1 N-acetylmuramoyl-L-alanine amidase [Stackebrandtia albiflava]
MSESPRVSRRSALRGAVVLGVGAAAGGGAVLTPTAAQAAVPRPTIASTSDWGARRPGSLTQLSNDPDKIVIHHTASANSNDFSLQHAYDLAYTIQGWHMNENNWSDSGQHFTISRGGHIMEGRHTSLRHLLDGDGMVQGAHAPGANTSGIGIENEGLYTSVLPTTQLWNSMVTFCAYICQQYGIRSSQIFGHRDFSATACPGNALYARLPQLRSEVQAKLDGGGGDPPDFQVVVDNGGSGFGASDNWGTSTYSSQRHGADYRFADPQTVSDAAYFRADIPAAGNYKIETWYPANAGYNSATPYVIYASDGNRTVHVDQRSNGGRWVSLGTFPLAAGNRSVVAVSRWTGTTGYVIADAVRISSA